MKRFLAVSVLCTASAFAQSVPEARLTVQQKAEFVRKLFDDTATTERIKASRDTQAVELLDGAREHYEHALSLLRAGDPIGAERMLDYAIGSASKARQRVPDASRRAIAERFEFARLIGGVESLRASYLRHRPKATTLEKESAFEAELERVDALIDDAKTLAAAEQFGPAIRSAQHAERGLIGGLSRLLGSATILYAQRFDSPAEEFVFELDRNRSYAELIPIALTELRPPASAARAIEAHVARNVSLREQAHAHAEKRDHNAAMRALRAGTEQLQRALALAGVVVPTDMPPEPAAAKR